MKKHSGRQIVATLREADLALGQGSTVPEVCKKIGVSGQTYYRWRQKYGGMSPSAIQAGVNRMRPIAMTTVAAILALMPLALGLGQGAAMQQPLAIAIIAGLTVQLPLALVVLPALLAILLPGRRTPKEIP
jgi:Cu/Ag efflux pump CusA